MIDVLVAGCGTCPMLNTMGNYCQLTFKRVASLLKEPPANAALECPLRKGARVIKLVEVP
jgi:hypothetical protein